MIYSFSVRLGGLVVMLGVFLITIGENMKQSHEITVTTTDGQDIYPDSVLKVFIYWLWYLIENEGGYPESNGSIQMIAGIVKNNDYSRISTVEEQTLEDR